jgi:hypothetical protein
MTTPPDKPGHENNEIRAIVAALAAAVARACGTVPQTVILKDGRGKTILRVPVPPTH